MSKTYTTAMYTVQCTLCIEEYCFAENMLASASYIK